MARASIWFLAIGLVAGVLGFGGWAGNGSELLQTGAFILFGAALMAFAVGLLRHM